MNGALTIKEISHLPIGTIAKYKVENLYQLLIEVLQELEQAKRTKQWLESAISLKYEEQIRAKRMRLEKDTGVIHLEDSGYKISSDVLKKVEWDQKKLAKIAANMLVNGANIADYIETYYSVPEAKYKGWPEGVRNIFEPARIVKLGKPQYKLTKLEQGEVL